MSDDDRDIKILAPAGTASRVSRRAFMGGSAVAVFSGSVLLAACGGDSDEPGGGTGTDAGSDTGTGAPQIEDQLNFYHWAEYDDPKLFKQFSEEFGPTTKIDIYASNEEMIAKLVAAAGTSGYDIVVPTGVYIPQMV
jgi:spermidine/putrescine transport system substrate-binding protein